MPKFTLFGLLRTFVLAQTPPALPNLSPVPHTVLITGSNSGLGLEAAHHFARLGTRTLILAVRSPATGDAAAAAITARAPHDVTTHVMQVDMASPTSIHTFVAELKTLGKIDAAVLNAGVISRDWGLSEEGWETTLQVNAFGTLLLGLLLLPILQSGMRGKSITEESKDEPDQLHAPALVFVSSALYASVPASAFPPPDDHPTPILPFLSAQPPPSERAFDTQAQYAVSKLLLMWGVARLARNHEVRVVSCCPGPCQSNLTRDFRTSWAARFGLAVYAWLFQRTAEQGARTLVGAVGAGPQAQGGFWVSDRWAK